MNLAYICGARLHLLLQQVSDARRKCGQQLTTLTRDHQEKNKRRPPRKRTARALLFYRVMSSSELPRSKTFLGKVFSETLSRYQKIEFSDFFVTTSRRLL